MKSSVAQGGVTNKTEMDMNGIGKDTDSKILNSRRRPTDLGDASGHDDRGHFEEYERLDSEKVPIVEVLINDQKARAVLDSGSDLTMLTEKFVLSMGIPYRVGKTYRLKFAGGSYGSTDREAMFTLAVGERRQKLCVPVAELTDDIDMIIGHDIVVSRWTFHLVLLNIGMDRRSSIGKWLTGCQRSRRLERSLLLS